MLFLNIGVVNFLLFVTLLIIFVPTGLLSFFSVSCGVNSFMLRAHVGRVTLLSASVTLYRRCPPKGISLRDEFCRVVFVGGRESVVLVMVVESALPLVG